MPMPGKVTLYHTDKENGEVRPVDLYTIDANDALRNHPDEYSREMPRAKIVDPATGEVVKTSRAKGGDVQSTEVTTERAGPTRADPPSTEAALRIDNPAVPQPVDGGAELGDGKAVARLEAAKFDDMSNTELRNLIEAKTGTKPTNFVKRDDLIAQAKTL
jgi:hypothetical protein